MRKRGKVDGNHAAITQTLRLSGWQCLSLASIGNGCPDVLAYHPGRQVWRLIEIKNGPTKKLTPDQEVFIAGGWPVVIVRSVEDAVNL